MINAAAIKIQSLYRGHIARMQLLKSLAATKEEEAEAKRKEEASAAIKIQSLYRGHIARNKYMQLLKSLAATKIQRIYRGYVCKSLYNQNNVDQ